MVDSVKGIFGFKETRQAEFVNPSRQSIEQTEQYANKQVIHTKEFFLQKGIVPNYVMTCTDSKGRGEWRPISFPSRQIVFSQIIRMEINAVCPESMHNVLYTDISGDFLRDDIIQATFQQDLEVPICSNFFITARMVQDDVSGNWYPRLWLWGDQIQHPYEIFVTITGYV